MALTREQVRADRQGFRCFVGSVEQSEGDDRARIWFIEVPPANNFKGIPVGVYAAGIALEAERNGAKRMSVRNPPPPKPE